MKRIVFYLVLLLFSACDEVNVKPKSEDGSSLTEAAGFKNGFVLDNQGSLFKNNPWYTYDLTTHLIFPTYDIYAFKTPQGVYKVQFLSYYKGESESGVYSLRIQRLEAFQTPWVGPGEMVDFEVDAKGCGNPFNNPDHAACMADPSQNAFTYLDLDTMSLIQMSDAEGAQNLDWDLAFKTTDVRLNSGTTGPGRVVGAVLQKQSVDGFSKASLNSMSPYYLPEGVDRVIHEPDWYKDQNGLRVGIIENHWTVQSMDGEYTIDVSFEVDDQAVADGFQTTLHVHYVLKVEALGSAAKTINLDLSSNSKAPNYCLIFSTAEVYKCTADRKDWDLKILGMQSYKNGEWIRDWRVFTGNGALGPF